MSDGEQTNNEEQIKLDKILEALEELKRTRESKSKKDIWDKLGIVGQLFSGVLLAAIGLGLTWFIAQSEQTSRQLNLDATDRQTVARYLERFDTAEPSKLVALLQGADVALAPKYSVPLAVNFAQSLPVEVYIKEGDIISTGKLEEVKNNEIVNEAAIALLQRLMPKDDEDKAEAREAMKKFDNPDNPQDKAVANFVLKGRSTVLFRVSNIDDFVDVYISDRYKCTYEYGDDPEWINTTEELKQNKKNGLKMIVRNGPKGPMGARVQVQAGAEQYDFIIRRNDRFDEGLAINVGLSLSVDTEGLFHLNGYQIVAKDREKPPETTKKCE